MKKVLQQGGVKFIGMSLLWASLLYGCVLGVFNITDNTNKKSEPVSYSQTSSKQIIPAHISVDSIQRNISITNNIFSYIIRQLKY